MLQGQIREELTAAMKAKEEPKLTVLRGLISAFTNELVASGKKPTDELSDDEILAVIKRQVKQRKDANEQYRKGGRDDLAQSEQAELEVLEVYLPQMMSVEEIKPLAEAKKEELGVADKSSMGKLIGALMKDLNGKADGGDVKVAVESLF